MKFINFLKSHIKSHLSKTKSGKVFRVKDYQNKKTKKNKDWIKFKELSNQQLQDIRDYSNYASQQLNGTLRRNESLNEEQSQMKNSIDDMISKSFVPKDMYVYRGLYDTWNFKISQVNVADIIEDKAFMSTSSEENIAEHAANLALENSEAVVLDILLPKNSNALNLSYFARQDEAEILLPRNSKLKVLNIIPIGDDRGSDFYTKIEVKLLKN